MPNTQRVVSPEDIDAVATLAYEIWNQHFPPIIGQGQVGHMLETLQSSAASDDGSMQLSKLYLRRSCRRREAAVSIGSSLPYRPH